MIMKRMLSFIVFFVASTMFLQAQNIGDKALLRPRTAGGWTAEKAKNSLGSLVAGNKIKDVPQGTIVEAVYGGNGNWLSTDMEPQVVYYGFEKLIPEKYNPLLVAGMNFRREEYATEFPTHKDKPKAVHYVYISKQTNEPDTCGNVIVKTRHITNPGQGANEKVNYYVYYGTFMPYYIAIDYFVDSKGQPKRIKRTPLYVNALNDKYRDAILGVYLSNIHFEKIR